MLQRARDFPLASHPPNSFSPSSLFLALKQTLETLPSHLLTPFNGPVPPSNLLDKIACGVADGKGPADRPRFQPATRSKIVELARR